MDTFATAKVNFSGLRAQTERLLKVSSRTLPQILNQTALNAIGRTVNETPKADRLRIKTALGQFIKVNRINKKGRLTQKTVLAPANFFKQGPRLALIINARRRRHGMPGLEGPEMDKAMAKALKGRLFSSGFEASAWFPGLRTLIEAISAGGKKPFIIARMRGIATVGRAKGEATPASRISFRPKVMVINMAKGIVKVGSAALQRGIDAEAAEIKRHIEEDLKPAADKFNEESKH